MTEDVSVTVGEPPAYWSFVLGGEAQSRQDIRAMRQEIEDAVELALRPFTLRGLQVSILTFRAGDEIQAFGPLLPRPSLSQPEEGP